MARLSVSASGLLGHYKYCKEKNGQLDREYKSCRKRKGQLDSERAYGRAELRRIRSVVNAHRYTSYILAEKTPNKLAGGGRQLKICQV